jgi:hypothetical protein
MSRSRRAPGPRPRPAPPRFALHGGEPTATRGLDRLAWAAIALYVLASLAMVFGPHVVGDVFTETDFYGSYGPGARALQHGHLDPSRYGVVGPVFEALLALVGFAVRDLFVAAQLLAVASMATALACWWSLVARRAGSATACLTVLFLAVNAQFYRYGWSATTDAPALALQAATLWALFAPRPAAGTRGAAPPGEVPDAPGPRRVFAAGVLLAFAFLTRYNSAALLPAGVVALAIGATGTPRPDRGRALLAFVAGFALPVAPWMLWSATHGGSLQFQLHHNIAYEVFARPKGIVWDVYARDLQPQFPTAWSVLARDPAAVVTRLAANVGGHLVLDAQRLAGDALALAAVAGLVVGWRDARLARLAPVLGAVALLFLSLVPVFHSERYSLAVLPAWAMLAALAFASPRFALPVGRVWAKLLLVPLVLAASLATTRALTARTLDQLPVEVREAARQVAPWVHPGDRVLARKPHFGWYAGLETMPLPLSDSLADWGAAATRDHARWLYFSWPEAQLRPAFEWLLDSTSAAPGLTVRAATSHWPALVYEIGPRFGAPPAWTGSDTLTALHRARARAAYDLRARAPRLFLALYEAGRGRHELAQRWLDELLSIAPTDPDALLLAADNRLALNDPAGALEYYDRLDRAHPGMPEVRVGRGWVAAMQGDEATAARWWAPVVGAADDANTLRRMAVAFARTGDHARLEEVRMRLQSMGVVP